MRKDEELSLVKLPPQNLEAEEAVLGAMLISQNDLMAPIGLLSGEMFYKPQHKIIFEAIKNLFVLRYSVDLLTVTDQLRKLDKLDFIGGALQLHELTQRVSSSANIEFHARIIIERYLKRKIIDISNVSISESYDQSFDVFEILDKLQTEILCLTNKIGTNKPKTLKQIVPEVLQTIEENQGKTGFTGIDTGLESLNSITGGFQEGLIIVGGRPGMGKTAIAVLFATRPVFQHNKVVLVFSLEMSDKSLACRILSSLSGVKYSNMTKGSLTDQDLGLIYDNIEPAYTDNLIIDETPSISVTQMRAKAMAIKMERGQLDMIVVDYLQLAKGEGKGNREQEISSISRGLKILSKELKIPVIALAQLGRATETRSGDKRPILADLRESGAIEQDADMVMFVYREQYYLEQQNQPVPDDVIDKIEIIIAKQRNGALDSIKTNCYLATNIIQDEEYIPEKRYNVLDKQRNTELLDGYSLNYESGDVNKINTPPF
jgi:replicative DNA helicase